MVDLLLAPGAPFFALSVAGVMLAVFSLSRMERARIAFAGVRSLPTTWGMHGRFVLG